MSSASGGHSLESFIHTVLLGDLKSMVYKAGLHYLSFGTVAVGIEFLGACTDSYDWSVEFKSRGRFSAGITYYMAKVDARYNSYNSKSSPHDLYKHLRCGMAHILKPQGAIGFSCRGAAQGRGLRHLEVIPKSTSILMTAEDFYDDFEKACNILLGALPSKQGPKFRDVYLPVSRV